MKHEKRKNFHTQNISSHLLPDLSSMRRAGADEEVLGKDWGRVQPQGSQSTFLSHPRGGMYILV